MKLFVCIICIAVYVLGQSQTLYKTKHLTIDDGLHTNTVTTIDQDQFDRLWIGTPNGLNVYNGFSISDFPGINERVMKLHSDSNFIYCLSFSGLYKIDPVLLEIVDSLPLEKDYYTPNFNADTISLISSNQTNRYLIDYQLNLIGQQKDLTPVQKTDQIFNINDNYQIHYGHQTGTKLISTDTATVSESYSSAAIRYDDIIFVGTQDGLIKINVENGIIKSNKLLEDSNIESLFIDNNKNIWIGTANNGLMLIHKNTITSTYYSFNKKQDNIACWQPFTYNNQLYVSTSDGIKLLTTTRPENNPIEMATRGLNCISAIAIGDILLIGTQSMGVYKFENQILKNIYFDNSNALKNTIIQFYKHHQNYIAISKKGFVKINAKGTQAVFQPYTFSDNAYIMHMQQIGNAGYLANTTDGIMFYDTGHTPINYIRTKSAKVFSSTTLFNTNFWSTSFDSGLFKIKDDSLHKVAFPESALLSLHNQNDTVLWIGSTKLIYAKTDNQVLAYSNENGFPLKEYNQNGMLNHQGKLIYSGVNGVFSFQPDSVLKPSNIPQVLLYHQNVLLNDSTDIIVDYNATKLSLKIEPILLSDANHFKIEYTTDSSWRMISKPAQLYLDLHSNQSKFEYRILFGNHVVFKRQVIINRRTPFWLSTWFISIVIITIGLLAVGFIYLIKYFQTKKKLKIELEEKKITNERLRISNELHDNIGARLTHIISSLDIELYKKNNNLNALENINAFARETINQLRETIWAVKDKSINYSEFIKRIEQYVLQINEIAGHQIIIQKASYHDFELNPIQTINFYRIIQEAINNSIKYANADQIIVQFQINGKEAFIKITDNGRGFNKDNVVPGSGMAGMLNRAHEAEAELTIHSTPDNGTEVIIKFIPLK